MVPLLASVLVAGLLPLLVPAVRSEAVVSAPSPSGYWLVASDGGIFGHGDAPFHGSTGAIPLNQPIVGMAASPSGAGYWMVASDGGIFAFGDAAFHGSTGGQKLNRPIAGMASTPSGRGYWLVASDGGIFAFGDAAFFGSTGAVTLNKPIVGMASTPSGRGYWLVASDGGIFAFGDAAFFGSTGAVTLNKPINGMTSTPSGAGYWLVASDGGLFAFGDARFHGSMATRSVTPATVVGMLATRSGAGYWQATSAGEVVPFGDATGGAPARVLNRPVVGLALARAAKGAPGEPGVVPVDPGADTTTTTTPAPTGGLLTPAEKGQPNIVVIVMDDMRFNGAWDDPGVMPLAKKWLLDGGTDFTEGYATTPLCCPERATIWSGRLPHNHKVFDNHAGDHLCGPAGPDQSTACEWIVPRFLNDAGYRTALIGKFITNWNYRYPIPHFTDYAAFQGKYLDARFEVKDPGETEPHDLRGFSTDIISDKAVQYIEAYEANDAQPFYLHITPHAPHDETDGTYYTAPRHEGVAIPEWEASPAVTVEGTEAEKADKAQYIRNNTQSFAQSKFTRDGQLRTLLAADEMVDRMFRTLEANGELDNTMVIFTSDNGYIWGERGLTSKGTPYLESVKVPFAVRWPGVVPAGAVDLRPVGGEDILPTILDAAQYTPPTVPNPFDGRSFLPGRPGKPFKYMEFGPGPNSNPVGYDGHRGIPTWASMRTTDWQYLEYYESADHTTIDFREYYDLKADPWMLSNTLADTNTANDPDVAAFSAQLAGLRRCAGTTGTQACP